MSFIIFFFSGQGDPDEGVECPRGEVPRDGMRRRARSIPRLDGVVPDRGEVARHKLPVHGGLRRQRILLRRDRNPTSIPQGEHILPPSG